MNGAESMVRTLLNAGIEICLTNPGTSELHSVAAMDRVPGIRMVLGLFEGVCTGAADGYARMSGKPAALLLHLGPGMANGIANLHNAKKANTPIVNIVGDHATYHLKYDAPLTSDIESLAGPVSAWVHKVTMPQELGRATADAVAAALKPPGGVATLIVPADCAWCENTQPTEAAAPSASPPPVENETILEAAGMLRSGQPTAFLVTGQALTLRGLKLLARIREATQARLFSQTFNARIRRGAGIPSVERLPYFVPMAQNALAPYAQMILVGANLPASFFAYPDSPSLMTPSDCRFHNLARPDQDCLNALERLAEELNAPETSSLLPKLVRPQLPSGKPTSDKVWATLAALMPENAIVVNESISSNFGEEKWLANAPPHDCLDLTGGAIGAGMPLATGAALACPDRKVFAMQADGSAMYTLQSLWTQAREKLDVVTVIFSNRSYAILRFEMSRVGSDSLGTNANSVLDIGHPDLDWVKLANAMGVEATVADTCEAFAAQLSAAIRRPGPQLIEVRL